MTRATKLLWACLGAHVLGACTGEVGSLAGGTEGSGGTAGSGGAAGSGPMRGYRPPADQISGCLASCQLEAQALCPGETTVLQCVESCHVGILFAACSELWGAFFQCAATAGVATCTPSGEARISDCAEASNAALNCVKTNGAPEAFAGVCTSYCNAESAAACENGDDFTGCHRRCLILASAFPVCAPDFQTFLGCGAGDVHTCDLEGRPFPVACAEQNRTFLECLETDYGWQLGQGIVR